MQFWRVMVRTCLFRLPGFLTYERGVHLKPDTSLKTSDMKGGKDSLLPGFVNWWSKREYLSGSSDSNTNVEPPGEPPISPNLLNIAYYWLYLTVPAGGRHAGEDLSSRLLASLSSRTWTTQFPQTRIRKSNPPVNPIIHLPINLFDIGYWLYLIPF
jgi:hypothetical protein